MTPADAAALGLIDQVREFLTSDPAAEDVSRSLWGACHGGRLETVVLLLDHGADVDWIPGWERLSPLDAAARAGASRVVIELRRRGARTAAELDSC